MTANPSQPGRNTPCPCGSGRKYKACCLDSLPGTDTTSHDLKTLQNLAQSAIGQGNFSEAERCFRLLHSARPNDAYILASLGQTLCWSNRKQSGLGYLRQAARQLERQATKTADPRHLIELSAQLLHWGEAAVAERLARLAIKLSPSSAAALNNLALCLSRVNRHQEALPLAQRVCRQLPDHPGANILLAIIEAHCGDQEAALARLFKVTSADAEPDQTARAWLESGVILDKLQRYPAAFAAFEHAAAAHNSLADALDGMREHIFTVLNNNKQGYTPALLQRWSRTELCRDGLPAPAFLIGFLRSGTTLTEQVIGNHPQLAANDESGLVFELGQELEKLSGVSNNHALALEQLDILQIGALRQFFWRRVREEHGAEFMHKQLVDKNAMNTIELGLISVIFPEAKILFALRDPRDVCISCFMQAFSLAPATVNLLSWQGIARQYAAVMDYWLTIRGHIQPDVLELHYEDCVADFETTYRQVFEFLGVDWRPEALNFHKRAHGRFIATPSFAAVSQPIYSTAVARWKCYADYYQPVLPLLQPYINAFGYGDEKNPGAI